MSTCDSQYKNHLAGTLFRLAAQEYSINRFNLRVTGEDQILSIYYTQPVSSASVNVKTPDELQLVARNTAKHPRIGASDIQKTNTHKKHDNIYKHTGIRLGLGNHYNMKFKLHIFNNKKTILLS